MVASCPAGSDNPQRGVDAVNKNVGEKHPTNPKKEENDMKTSRLFRFSVLPAAVAAACLTVNVYIYPSKEVDATAQKLIEDIRGEVLSEKAPASGTGEEGRDKADGNSLWWPPVGFVGVAHAAGGETTVSSPAIDAIKLKIKNRGAVLNPFFDAGAVGEGRDGLVAVRDISALPMQDRARVNRVVKEENDDRLTLYREVAKELKVEEKDLPKVRESFAREWQRFARPGWWVQTAGGTWERRRP